MAKSRFAAETCRSCWALASLLLLMPLGCSLKSWEYLQQGPAANAGGAMQGDPAGGGANVERSNQNLHDGWSIAIGGRSNGSEHGTAGASTGGGLGGEGSVGEPHRALLVVGKFPLDASDLEFEQRLTTLDYRVQTTLDEEMFAADTFTVDLIAVTRSTASQKIDPRLRDLEKPVLVWEPRLYGKLGMVADDRPSGAEPDRNSLTILDSASPLAAGLIGEVAVLKNGADLAFGAPNENAMFVATIPGGLEKVAIFAYEPGAEMPGLRAPAKRVALFFSTHKARDVTDEGWRLFDAAVRWADPRTR